MNAIIGILITPTRCAMCPGIMMPGTMAIRVVPPSAPRWRHAGRDICCDCAATLAREEATMPPQSSDPSPELRRQAYSLLVDLEDQVAAERSRWVELDRDEVAREVAQRLADATGRPHEVHFAGGAIERFDTCDTCDTEPPDSERDPLTGQIVSARVGASEVLQ